MVNWSAELVMLLPPEMPSSWKLGPSTFAPQLVPEGTLTVHALPAHVKFCTAPSIASASNVMVAFELRWNWICTWCHPGWNWLREQLWSAVSGHPLPSCHFPTTMLHCVAKIYRNCA